ncbi:MAG: hypothetical protein KDA28_16180, partial [Phycisphaerales bacterium]|nr:hypothetical protein [Phycisphaerales bacterium]
GIHSICIDPRDTSNVRVGISCGGVWKSTDRGATWACRAEGMIAEYMPPGQERDPNIQDPHLIAQCAAAPDVLWTQHHNGVFRTTDDCTSWHRITSVTPSQFGFAVAVHPQDPETAWFVPGVKDECRVPVDGALAVARTRDGGATFEACRSGLPQRDAYDIVYRHAFDVNSMGDLLVMGSTTGNLWASKDGGDTWIKVSSNMPPIHSVRVST